MSISINIENISQEQREKIHSDLTIKIDPPSYSFGAKATYLYPYDISGDNVILPFSYAVAEGVERPSRESFPSLISTTFTANLRENQKQVRDEALQFLKKGSVLISCYTGFGKTLMSIYLAIKINLKVLIIVKGNVLIKQWENDIQKVCPDTSIQILSPKTTKLQQDSDFYISSPDNIKKLPRSLFKHIGTVLVDESHQIMAESLSLCMQYVCPRYLIGLSATPYRPDGLNKLFDIYFGENKIVRKLYRKHTVYKVQSGFTPEVEMCPNGKINWGVVLNSQASNKERNELIIKIVMKFPENVFLILSKRVEQATYLVDRLREEGEDVTSLIGSQKEYEKTSRILVGTITKVGTGFNHPRLNSLIIAGDVEEYFQQYLGRVFRREDSEPVVFDIIDKNPILLKHFRSREKIYKEYGGIVKKFETEFPDF
jgi:superfamily II DNA or RNA helicase